MQIIRIELRQRATNIFKNNIVVQKRVSWCVHNDIQSVTEVVSCTALQFCWRMHGWKFICFDFTALHWMLNVEQNIIHFPTDHVEKEKNSFLIFHSIRCVSLHYVVSMAHSNRFRRGGKFYFRCLLYTQWEGIKIWKRLRVKMVQDVNVFIFHMRNEHWPDWKLSFICWSYSVVLWWSVSWKNSSPGIRPDNMLCIGFYIVSSNQPCENNYSHFTFKFQPKQPKWTWKWSKWKKNQYHRVSRQFPYFCQRNHIAYYLLLKRVCTK